MRTLTFSELQRTKNGVDFLVDHVCRSLDDEDLGKMAVLVDELQEIVEKVDNQNSSDLVNILEIFAYYSNAYDTGRDE